MATVFRFVFQQALIWIGLTVVFLAGLSGLATVVENTRLGPIDSLKLAVFQAPGILVSMAPIICAGGAAMASVRMAIRGEQIALDSAGISPWYTAAVAARAGLLIGFLQWGIAGHIVHRSESAAEPLRNSPAVEWVWMDEGALRTTDRLWVARQEGRITSVSPNQNFSLIEIQNARMRQRPKMASAHALHTSNAPTAKLEQHNRLAHVLACAAMAGMGWRIRARPTIKVGVVTALALGWQLAALGLYTAAAQGHISVLTGGWLATVVLCGVLSAGWFRAKRHY